LADKLKTIIEKAVLVLTKQKEIETKSLRKAGKKELKDDDDSDDDEGAESDYEPSGEEGNTEIKDEEEKKGEESHAAKVGGKEEQGDTETDDDDDSIDEMVITCIYSLVRLECHHGLDLSTLQEEGRVLHLQSGPQGSPL
jgi:hypothetical protein